MCVYIVQYTLKFYKSAYCLLSYFMYQYLRYYTLYSCQPLMGQRSGVVLTIQKQNLVGEWAVLVFCMCPESYHPLIDANPGDCETVLHLTCSQL